MKEKELKICIWIHHIATFIGVVLSIRALRRRQESEGRRCALVLFLVSQVWAVIKIVSDYKNGSSRLAECLNNICEQSRNEYQARGIVASLISGSVLFKVGIPLVNSK